jgi:protein phosphatase
VASATVITALRAYDADVPVGSLLATISRAVARASDAIRLRIETDPALAGMGTTLTAMLWSGGHFALAHIGDSRAYLLRGGVLNALTEDHTVGRLVADAGQLAPVITRYLDGRLDRSPDLAPIREALVGDRYLLCSDGLSGVVDRAAMQQALETSGTCKEAVGRLAALAYAAGAPDNVTVVVLDVISEAVGDSAEAQLLGAAAQPVPL